MNNPAQFDRATLAAVKPGVDSTLGEMSAQLERFFEDALDVSALNRAQAELHRLLGVFRMIRLEGIVVYCTEMETVLNELAVSPQLTSALHKEELRSATNALMRYLDDLAQGADNTVLRLFPNYQQLQQLRGLEISFDQDLFYPNLAVQLPPAILGLARFPDPGAYFKAARNYYQQGLLRYLRHEDPQGALKLMQQAVNVALSSMPQDDSRAFWWVCSGLIDCVGRDGLPPDLSAQKALAKIDQQMRAVIAGAPSNQHALMNEMLYLVGRSHNVSGIVASIKQTYALDRYFPESTAISPVELARRLGVMRELLRSTEEQWENCAHGEHPACANFVNQARLIEQQTDQMDLVALQYLTQQISKFAAMANTAESVQRIGMDMAVALLLLGSGISHYRELDGGFQEQVRLLAEKMQAEVDGQQVADGQLSPLINLYCQTERSDALQLLSKEMLINLQQVENGLNVLFEDISRQDELTAVHKLLKQVQGGMQLSGLRQASQLTGEIRESINLLVEINKPIKPTDSRVLASALSQLEGYLEQIPNGHEDQVDGLSMAARELQQLRKPTPPTLPVQSVPEVVEVRSAEDQELLEIFLEEATEVLGIMRESLEACQAGREDGNALVTIRRGFHTLKGSGRMVGLVEIGEVAWAAENAMNKWLQAKKGQTSLLLDFIDKSIQAFSGWVDELGTRGVAQVKADALIKLAQRIEHVAMGGGDEAPLAPSPVVEPVVQQEAPVAVEAREVVDPDHLRIGDRVLSKTLFKIASEEARQHVTKLRNCFEELRKTPALLVQYDFMRAAHTLVGVNRAMGFTEVVELAFALETWLQARIDTPAPLQQDEVPMLEAVIGGLEAMAEQVCGQSIPKTREDLIARLRETRELASVVSAPESVPVPPAEAPSVALLDGLSLHEEVSVEAVVAPAAAVLQDAVPLPIAQMPVVEPVPIIEFTQEVEPVRESAAEIDTSFLDDLLVPTVEALPSVELEIEQPADAMAQVPEFEIAMAPADEAIVAVEPVVVADNLFDFDLMPSMPVAAVEPVVPLAEGMPAISFDDVYPPEVPAVEPILASDAEHTFEPALAPVVEPLIEVPAVAPAVVYEQPAAPAPRAAVLEDSVQNKDGVVTVRDDVDEQLLPVFLEEADELMPKMGNELRAWRNSPGSELLSNSLKRLLHTIKGSSRMAGAMRIGEIAHDMESRVIAADKLQHQPGYWDGLEHEFDRISTLLEHLRAGKFDEPVATVAEVEAETEAEAEDAQVQDPGRKAGERAAQSALLRVRADVVDLLVNEAGEISVARARMETELQTFKEALMELTGSVNRLRQQLREVEIQAESQMQARINLSQTDNEQFDPLEFDRFTRLQELTRFMNESVHDVQTVQQTLLKNLDETMLAISVQTRLNRDLQQRLMNVRMVPFNSIAERLYRIMRQTGKELRKRANLELQGGYIELDRSVLEKMTAPFEHLLRNAIAHGLEDEDERQHRGKGIIGDIRLSLRQENNEVVFELSDDGGGLNFAALREKAKVLGFSKQGVDLTEQQLSQLIFVSGVSTASEVSAVAGRGIGMDVVRSEIAGLGGRIDVSSQSGQGTRFTIHLPLTLAVMQTVMVRSGDAIYAIPATMVEQVQQIRNKDMAQVHASGAVEFQQRSYPLHYLPVLLGDEGHVAENHIRNAVLLLRGAEQRIALHVDELLGRQEAVVKNIGPQLARMIGIAGATVRGDGQVVLILNPVQMAQRVKTVAKPQAIVKEETLRSQPVVMVVDDSLTVRKITSRLLMRAGYHVVTATDGMNALEQLTEMTPDVMLLDVEMPRMDGFELTKNIRRSNTMKQFPIIMITSRTANKHRDYAMQLGVNAYLGKPYQEDDLLKRIADFVTTPSSAAA